MATGSMFGNVKYERTGMEVFLAYIEECRTENKLLDDLARLASGAAGSLADLKAEIEVRAKEAWTPWRRAWTW